MVEAHWAEGTPIEEVINPKAAEHDAEVDEDVDEDAEEDSDGSDGAEALQAEAAAKARGAKGKGKASAAQDAKQAVPEVKSQAAEVDDFQYDANTTKAELEEYLTKKVDLCLVFDASIFSPCLTPPSFSDVLITPPPL